MELKVNDTIAMATIKVLILGNSNPQGVELHNSFNSYKNQYYHTIYSSHIKNTIHINCAVSIRA